MNPEPEKAARLAEVRAAAKRAASSQAKAEQNRTERDARIIAAASHGATYPELARASGLSYDRVKQILNPKRG